MTSDHLHLASESDSAIGSESDSGVASNERTNERTNESDTYGCRSGNGSRRERVYGDSTQTEPVPMAQVAYDWAVEMEAVTTRRRWAVTRTGDRDPIPSHVRAAVWYRDGGRCANCGRAKSTKLLRSWLWCSQRRRRLSVVSGPPAALRPHMEGDARDAYLASAADADDLRSACLLRPLRRAGNDRGGPVSHLSPAAQRAVAEARAVLAAKRGSNCRHGINRDRCDDCQREDERLYRNKNAAPGAVDELRDIAAKTRAAASVATDEVEGVA